MPTEPSLEKLRLSIDGIDDEIHNLLLRRTDVVKQIGALKRSHNTGRLPLRPSREATIIRRLVTRHRGPFPINTLFHIWRELLSGQSIVQSQFSVALCQDSTDSPCRNIVRDHFGGSIKLLPLTSPHQVVKAVSEDTAPVGVLPVPSETIEDPWWAILARPSNTLVHVIARVPFLKQKTDKSAHDDALMIGKVPPEPSGDDISVLAVKLRKNVDRTQIPRSVYMKDAKAKILATSLNPNQEDPEMHLVSIDGFVRQDEPVLRDLVVSEESPATEISVVGAYAKQLTV